jgi:voltage-gated potassium channel
VDERGQSEGERLYNAVRPFFIRFSWVVAYFAALMVVGTVGYASIEEWGWVDAFFMSAITASSVGYGEVHPLTEPGRMFTVALMAASVVGLGVLWALITALLVELDLGGLFRRRRIMRRIRELNNHYIVCGAGRMGRVVARELVASGEPFVIIEQNQECISALLEEEPGLLIIAGDATREHLLRLAGIERARGMAACLPNDAANLFLVLTTRGLVPDMEIVARAYDEESLKKLRRAGANHVISPAVTGAIRVASTLLRPSVVSFLDAVTNLGPEMSLRLEEATIPAGSHLIGKSLADASIPQQTGLIVLALRTGASLPTFNPGPDTSLAADDVMVVLGNGAQVQRLRDYAAEGVG